MVMMRPAMVVVAVPTFADAAAANWNAVMKPAAAMAADGNALMEATAVIEATTASMEAGPPRPP
jgi:hypothetical protein